MSTAVYDRSEAGLASFYAKVYSLVGMGIGLSAAVAGLMLYVFPDNMQLILVSYPWLYYGAMVIELALVFVAGGAARQNTPMALPLFLAYSALNGFTLSFILKAYAQTTVFQALVSSALVFFVMAMIGRRTHKDLSGMKKAMMAALIGVLLASLVNLFLSSSLMSYLISLVSVLVFSGLIAYDNQLIKGVYEQTGGQVTDGWAISLALSLYLDFVNLFLSLLRLLGRRD
ncbi:Bax inhibitor-1/YccA family protein [Streptococcus cuniculipharyngis]|uniref:Bax inhibitor-1/YccA family protein n=1 Tax=Streptococcus cuniculipharyngis TaxID=1562651 RepID=A0A5C5SE15_9STRE|nr:Bax inhibitor-1/YccA family protein [Streptococcus cuniculipharyngis]TWS98143.1 Bax inhibitor-1/YccA family protein [Streptococcus cuniculipharyngis]